jgi:hypothetical protein
MEKVRGVIQIQEELGDTRALIIDNDFPFLTEILSEKLLQRGCEVDRTPLPIYTYDYIICLGISKKIQKNIKKAPNLFPFPKLLKDDGKAIIVVSQITDLPPKKDIATEVLFLDVTHTFSASTLSDKILKKLFTSPPIHIKDPPVKKNIYKEVKEKNTHHSSSQKRKRLLFAGLVCLFLFSPLFVYIGSVGASAYLLSKTIQSSSPADRTSYASYAYKSAGVAKQIGGIFQTLLFPFSQKAGTSIEGLSDLVFYASHATLELTGIEDVVRRDFPSLFKGDSTNTFEQHIPLLQEKLTSVENNLEKASRAARDSIVFKKLPFVGHFFPEPSTIEDMGRYINEAKEVLTVLPTILAFHKEQTYLLLFQNNFELRPTGGFIGSYGLVTFNNGKVKNITIEDVYQPDGQLKGHVEPPLPISKYLGQPNWYLRDSNWNPDFLLSAKQTEWFLEKEIGKTVDGVIAVDLYFVQDFLNAIDGVYVPDYKARVTGKDFFLKLQSDTHDDFFPGSNEKKSLLSSLLSAITIELTDRNSLPYIPLTGSFAKSLSEKHMLLYFHDSLSQQVVEKLGWGGRLLTPPVLTSAMTPAVLDYSMVIDANLGVNKVNYFIEREFLNSVSLDKNSIIRELTIYYKNRSTQTNTLFGGDYKNFVRILIPLEASVKQIQVGDKNISLETDIMQESLQDKKTIGFLINVPQKQEEKVTITYTLPLPASKKFSYYLIIQKQPGTNSDPFVFKTKNNDVWNITTSSIPALPYLSNLSVDRLLSLDFEAKIE